MTTRKSSAARPTTKKTARASSPKSRGPAGSTRLRAERILAIVGGRPERASQLADELHSFLEEAISCAVVRTEHLLDAALEEKALMGRARQEGFEEGWNARERADGVGRARSPVL